MLYLAIVIVFLIASIMLLFWNRRREKIRAEQMCDSGMAAHAESHLPTRRPKIKKRSNIGASAENEFQGKLWYYSIDGVSKLGPITEEEMRRLLSSRRLLPNTLVWTQGLPYWSEASSLESLMTSQ
jgi:hypothetical protein